MPISSSPLFPKGSLLILGLSFIVAVLLSTEGIELNQPADLITSGFLLATFVYTLTFAAPLWGLLALVQWLEKKVPAR